MQGFLIAAGLLILGRGVALAQAAVDLDRFEVASIRPTSGIVPNAPPRPMPPESNRVEYKLTPLEGLLAIAFRVRGDEIVGPDWMGSERFDISALIPSGADRSRIPVMLQNLLVDRFGLHYHMEQRIRPGYELKVSPKGLKLVQSEPVEAPPDAGGGKEAADGFSPPVRQLGKDGFQEFRPGGARTTQSVVQQSGLAKLTVVQLSMAECVQWLRDFVDGPVSDRTGLTGKYSFELVFAKDPSIVSDRQRALLQALGRWPLPVAEPSSAGGPTISSALESQLGLRLEKGKASVDVLVVDQIEKSPTPN